MTATITSDDYQHTFFGILNVDGQFWTPLAFSTEAEAWSHLMSFWGPNKVSECLKTFDVVPVRITLEQISSDRDGSPQGRDAQRLGGGAVTARAVGVAQNEGPSA